MAGDPITDNDDLVEFSICTAQDLLDLVPPDQSGRDAIWTAFHKAAWIYHVLPALIAREATVTEEDDITDTTNLKVMVAMKCYILALETRGNQQEGSDHQVRVKALRADYKQQIAQTSVVTATNPSVPRPMRSVTMFRGA